MKSLISIGAVLSLAWADTDGNAAVNKRLEEAHQVIHEIMQVEDKAIPQDLLARANCVVIVPGVKKGAFIVGAKYGKGFVTCRNEARGWSPPAAVRMEGGSVGFQIGGSESDVVLLILNERGADRLMKSEFKLGGEAAVAAGPVGRTASAETDVTMKAEMLGYSRARGVFAGLSLAGSTLREDLDDNEALYGKKLSTEQILRGNPGVAPNAAKPLLQTLARYSSSEKK